MNQILGDTYLNQKKSVLVFQNMQFKDDEMTVVKFIKFIKRLRNSSQLRVIMIVDQTQESS